MKEIEQRAREWAQAERARSACAQAVADLDDKIAEELLRLDGMTPEQIAYERSVGPLRGLELLHDLADAKRELTKAVDNERASDARMRDAALGLLEEEPT